jgi:hypothetical protein
MPEFENETGQKIDPAVELAAAIGAWKRWEHFTEILWRVMREHIPHEKRLELEAEIHAIQRADADAADLRLQSGKKLEIDRDNLRGTLDWIREKVSPYLIGPDFNPNGRATENLIATLLERYDAQYERLKYLESVAPPLCPGCGAIREHQTCSVRGATISCLNAFHFENQVGQSDTFGCALAMEVLQSELYHKLNDEARGECDHLLNRWKDHLRTVAGDKS